jgi:NAD+-dependent protein deacetylase sirtuin 2
MDKKTKVSLDSSDLSGIAKYILNGAKNIIVMTGAGISVSAGIPDFRTPGTGLYSKLESYNLPYPEAIFSLDFFRKNPKPFYTLAKEIYPGSHCPTPTHYFLKLLADKKILLRVFTQNIDSLEGIAGIDPSLIVAAHGNFDTATCIDTGKKVNSDEVKKSILLGEEGWKKMNTKHCGLVKPDIVFFGEPLPERFVHKVNEDFPKCDLLIVMGTSLTVQPFASLITRVQSKIPRLLINKEKVGQKSNGFKFNKKSRDVALLNECDNGVRELAKELGWLNDLERLIKKSNEKL